MLVLLSREAAAGPPYTTDDPEPVPYRHWELYLASQTARGDEGFVATSPHFEANYGAAPDMHLHVIAPFVLAAPSEGPKAYGYGDTELGVKYRFVHEGRVVPEVGTFPLVLVPTGSKERGLGSGNPEFFVPVWLQKSFGGWSTYGGGGYWVHPGLGNRNWWLLGWQIQRRIGPYGSLGVEVFHTTPTVDGGRSDTGFNVGSVIDLSDIHHILLSAGRNIAGPNRFQSYVAYVVTFGPKE
ncbi:MAG: hypothetical protein ACXWP4_02380 [Polyangiales bacterium]